MGSSGFVLIVIAFIFLWLVLVRPQRRRQVAQQRMLDQVKVGDEIVTAGGIYGEVRELRDDEVLVRIAPELDVRVARRAIAAVMPADADEEEPGAAAEEEPEQNGPTAGT